MLATLEIAGWSRYVRSSMLEVVGQDYVRTARAKGLAERVVIYSHALRNALLPLITLIGMQGGRLLGGAMVTEVVFAWPGMGRLLAESLAARDYPVLMAAFMLMSDSRHPGQSAGRRLLCRGGPADPARASEPSCR